MWNELQEQQIALQVKIDTRDKYNRKKAILQRQLKEQQTKRDSFYNALTKEQQDVHDLDQFSFINMLRNMTGKMDEVREKELVEAAEAELKWNEAEKMVQDLQQDYDEIEQKLANPKLEGLTEQWRLLMDRKESWLRENSELQRDQLDSFNELQGNLVTLEREISEAHSAGVTAIRALRKASSHLDSAKTMSTWDTFFGGGLIATAMKHNRINDSEDAIHKAQLQLTRFEAELEDVNDTVTDGMKVDRGSFLTFADYFFDDIFSEWTVHSRINNSIDNVQRITSKVEAVCIDLDDQKNKVRNQLTAVKRDIQKLILG